MNIISPKTMWLLILLVAICSFSFFDYSYLYVPHVISKIVFIVCALVWLTLICSAFFVHREAYKNSYATSGIITTGIYKKIDHPMYMGDIILFIGIAFLFPIPWVLVTLFFGILIFVWFMNIEEGVLRERFGISPRVNKEQETKKTNLIEKKSRTTRKTVGDKKTIVKKPMKSRASKTKKEVSEI